MDHIEKTISTFEDKLKAQEDEVAKTKALINRLHEAMGRPPVYEEAGAESKVSFANLRTDQFYGRALLTVAREILEMRQAANMGPAAVAELYDIMVRGGYKFETDDAENAKRGLRVMLTKRSEIFHRLPGGEWGLLKWYPYAKVPK